MAYQINKGADRPPQVRGVVGMDYLRLLLKKTLVVVVVGASCTLLPLPGWLIFFGGGGVIYYMYMQLVTRSANQGAGGFARQQARQRLPGIITVRSAKVYQNLRKAPAPTKNGIAKRFF